MPDQHDHDVDFELNPGEWIERQCRELNISIARLAREARVSPSTIFRWRAGMNGAQWDTFVKLRITLKGFWDRREREKEGSIWQK